jgi:hypothetical protein
MNRNNKKERTREEGRKEKNEKLEQALLNTAHNITED